MAYSGESGETLQSESACIGSENVEKLPSWFTPKRMLFIFCLVNLVNYIDRGAISSNGVNGIAAQTDCQEHAQCEAGSGIQGDFNLSNFEDGLLPAAFMIGLLIFSPIFAFGSRKFSPFRLIGIGLGVWSLAIVGCALSNGLWSIFISRMLAGVGEASFISLSAPFIVSHAPAGSTGSWLSLFYMAIPVGYALGYILGGFIPLLFGSWRAAFWAEAIIILPAVAFFGFAEPVSLTPPRGPESTERSQAEKSREEDMLSVVLQDLKSLATNRTYVTNVMGYSAYTFVIGSYAYWGPKAAKVLFDMESADAMFGIVTVVAGIGGTLMGGKLLDHLGGSTHTAFLIMGSVTITGGLFCLLAFLSPNASAFIPLLLIGEFFVLAIQGPANIVSLQSVAPELRAISIAGSTIATHLFGDVPSPPILGALQDLVGNWRLSMGVFTAIFVPCSLMWFSGALITRGTDRVKQDIEQIASMDAEDVDSRQSAPLLKV